MASSEEEWEVDGGGFRGDGATPSDRISQRSEALDVRDNVDSDTGGSGAERRASAEQSPSKHATSRGANPRKRGRRVVQSHNDDDDFESQPTITKWFRQVPGPLHDVMKKQHLDLQQSLDDDGVPASGRSSGHIVHISTVFDTGAWLDMCDFLGMATTPGELYGGIKMSSLKHTIAHIQEHDDPSTSPQVPRLLVLIKSMRYVDEEIVAVFHDPSGEMEGYFHRDIVEQVGPALVNGTAVLLRDVSAFAPSDSAVGGANKWYLNITPRNVVAMFPATAIAAAVEAMVRVFNDAQTELIKADNAAEEEDLEDESLAPQRPADVRTTTTELSFISQRQVVQRHQPVRPDPNDAAADGSNGTTAGKRKKKKDKEAPTGLGRWQWHQLAQKKPATTANDEPEDTPTKPRRPVPSGRFTELLSQHIQARRTAAAHVRERPVDAPAAVGTASLSQRGSTTAIQAAPAKSVRFTTIEETTIDEDDDDDDW